ncbi:Type III flagellar switch regulator (C-ring) FliN C-term [Aeromonas sp. RU39B]|uniref:FliM/FliN family flagellar motor C-terminal domain-containing protein n=1 Tax=Aeromonas sp. RU39B TaxID=1907416 RepID=UPI0009552FA0|nr:FliM/FliN family flagellar motor C-terminal domain-containing protein [Aeromonas sp. RU39B]SIR16052.1 Type III flagellar switch regulator (C-ring) FliN C-term [Aeromonas sp. RU39B]
MFKKGRSGTHEPRMWQGAEADRFPVMDLLQVEGSAHEQLRHVNAQRRSFASLCGNCMGVLFNGHACHLSLAPFAACEAPGIEESSAQDIWLLATGEQPHAGRQPQALLQIEHLELFRLAVLFFGGRPLGTERENTKRSPTDAEIRLLQRLLQHQLDILSSLLGWDEQSWDVGTGAADQLPEVGRWLWTRVEMNLGEHKVVWRLYWPLLADSNDIPVEKLDADLQLAVHQVPVRLQVVMQQWNMNLAEVSELTVGDTLSLDLSEPLPARLGAQTCLRGNIAEHQGNLVFQVTDL